ncbi:unnamed protein product [Adineta ricciae]|uniref:Uncharacterized protein n=1 Tax=Adineta ricciae TaxID=249248 RepID=A0A815MK14_ADIRI|nr:unnamed protein product [Adineta ricciae]CAF1425665.1 unnamed protein product [Adineta ricciae]
MYKKSITRIEKENESSQAELSNPALQDIIATNHVMLTKKSHNERFSRACKAVIIMIILGLIAVGIIVLTVVLAHSRNSLMAIAVRSSEANLSQLSNHTRLLLIPQENLTTISNEPRENETWQKAIVSLTSDNLPVLTTTIVHLSSTMMRTEQQNEDTSTIRFSPLTNRIFNEQTTDTPILLPTTMISTQKEEEVLLTTLESQEHLQTTSINPETSIADSTSISITDSITSSVPEQTSFTTFITRHFNIESSTMTTKEVIRSTGLMDKLKAKIDDDLMNELLFS